MWFQLLGLPEEEHYDFGDEHVVIRRDLKPVQKYLSSCTAEQATQALAFYQGQYPTKKLSLEALR